MATETNPWDVFLDVHTDLPREGPGSLKSTSRAVTIAAADGDLLRVLDIGCGTGKQTLDLADLLPRASLTGIDTRKAFVDEANRRAAEAGVGERVRFTVADMAALDFDAGSFDLIWCEGAAYILGVPESLRAWRHLLSPKGVIAFTDAVWLKPDPPRDLLDWWAQGYSDMTDISHREADIVNCGYQLLGQFVLEEAAWWDDYYDPMAARIQTLLPKYAGNAEANQVLERCQLEIDYYRKYSDYYGYAFFVAARTEDPTPQEPLTI